MTEVAGLLETHQFTSPKLFATSSTSTSSPSPVGHELVDADTFATTKEEEWVSKKKTEIVNKKQIETRVKRQVVLEDGKVVEDTGPMVTTNTTEDTETKENHQTEHRKLGNNDDHDGIHALEGGIATDKSNWVAVPNSDGMVREVKERRVVSREETEDVKETEEVQHLGDITEEDFLAAIKSGKSDLRTVLKSSEGGRTLVSTGPRLIRDTSKTKKVTDTEETKESSSVQPDGKIVTETQRTTEHEELDDDEYPEDGIEQNYEKSGSQRYVKTRDQEDVDYFQEGRNVGHAMKYKTETMEVEKRGEALDEPDLFESLSARAKGRANKQQPHRYRGVENGVASPLDRKDALTRRPINFDQEEETRKVETSKWLEHHFGSESRSSNSTLDILDELDERPSPKSKIFNVTVNKNHSSTIHKNFSQSSPRLFSPVEPERNHTTRVFSPANSERNHTTRVDINRNHTRVDHTPRVFSPSSEERIHTPRVFSPVDSERNHVNRVLNHIEIEKNHLPRVFSPAEREIKQNGGYFKGISDWTERRQEKQFNSRTDSPYVPSDSPKPYITSPSPSFQEYPPRKSPIPDYRTPTFDSLGRRSPLPDYRHRDSPVNFEGSLRRSPKDEYVRPQKSPVPDYIHHTPSPDYGRPLKKSPPRDASPQPPQRTKKEKHRQKVVEERTRYDSGYRSRQEDSRDEVDDPPIDYSPPTPPPILKEDRKPMQKTRFAKEPPSHRETKEHHSSHKEKTKSGNIIGQSFRKLVNKIRSASAERKEKKNQSRVKRSPSPSYQQGHVIDYNSNGHAMDPRQPVQRYYLGEDPFGGSIFGREDKYDGVKPARSSRKRPEDEKRTHHTSFSSTLGRFSKSTGRLAQNNRDGDRSSQTLPRRLNKSYNDPPTRMEKSGTKASSTLNVSSSNHNSTLRFANDGPPKPSRTYKSNLARSKSLIETGHSPTRRNMYTSNPHINRIDENPTGLKSPGLISSLSRSKLDDLNEDVYVPRFYKNGDTVDHSLNRRYSPPTFETKRYSPSTLDHKRYSPPTSDSKRPVLFEKSENKIPGGYEKTEKRIYIHSSKDRPSDIFRNNLIKENGDDSWRPKNFSTPIGGKGSRNFNGDIYEPPTRLRDTHIMSSTSSQPQSILRRGSNSSTDFSETYRTTTRNDDPVRPSVTNTVKTVSKKTLPSKNGRSFETIESSEMQSVTKSQFKESRPSSALKFYESERRYSSSNGSSRNIPVEFDHYRTK